MSWRTLVSRSGRVEVAAEVLADHDVGGELRPEVRDLDVLLLEDALAGLVGDAGGPVLPGDLVVRVDARASSSGARTSGPWSACRRDRCHRSSPRTGRRGDALHRVLPPLVASNRPRPDCRSLGPSAVSSPHPAVAAAPSSSVVRRGSLGRLSAASIGRREPRIRVFSGDVATRLRYASSGRASSPKTQDVVVARACRPLDVVFRRFHARSSFVHVRRLPVHGHAWPCPPCLGGLSTGFPPHHNRTGVRFAARGRAHRGPAPGVRQILARGVFGAQSGVRGCREARLVREPTQCVGFLDGPGTWSQQRPSRMRGRERLAFEQMLEG